MNKFRLNYKRLSIWVLLFTQILLITSYFYVKSDNDTDEYGNGKISFVASSSDREVRQFTYHTTNSKIYLKSVNTRASFMDFNSSLCYVNGTDLVSMQRSTHLNWQCNCLPGWHGKDCGQPEVIWRAFLTYRSSITITGPRTFQRRIIYLFAVDKFSETVADIRLNELGGVVDLFVLYEPENSDFLENKLQNNFGKEQHRKILYVKTNDINSLWKPIKNTIKNLRDDDVMLTSNSSEIPNKYALNFLKYYNKWPEPVRFRLRWSVFGFFWVHPAKTIITGGASSIAYLKQSFNYKLSALNDNKTLSNPLHKGIILGDLNHYGGWYCEFCHDAAQIIESLSTNPRNSINLEKIDRRKIDGSFVEDVIENGLYIDGKTELVRARKYQDNYFAPYHVTENNWKYDFLLVNFYSKLDYYEG